MCISFTVTYFDREIIYMFKLNQKHVLDIILCVHSFISVHQFVVVWAMTAFCQVILSSCHCL